MNDDQTTPVAAADTTASPEVEAAEVAATEGDVEATPAVEVEAEAEAPATEEAAPEEVTEEVTA